MIAIYLLLSAGIAALEAWVVMLLIGAIHSNVPEFPTFNFWGSVFLVLLLNILGLTAVAVKEASK